MQAMVRDMLSEYFEYCNTFEDTMFGLCPHKSAQDILLQLSHDMSQPTEHPHNDKVVIAIDLKGAFDNIKHSIILVHLSDAHCGTNTFNYIKDFLTDRVALIRIQDNEYGPCELGSIYCALFSFSTKHVSSSIIL